MKLLIVLSLLFGIPFIEFLLFLEAGEKIGAFPTIVSTLLTASIGIMLAKKQGLQALKSTKMELDAGGLPIHAALNGVGILGAALMLFIPGFFTDSIGLCLFIPKLRLVLMNSILKITYAKIDNHSFNKQSMDYSDPRHGPIIDGKEKSTATSQKQSSLE
jgi:UPF0716 family protein affecting phage T7 exclusion